MQRQRRRPTVTMLLTVTLQVCTAQSCSVPEMDLIGFSIMQTMAKRTQ